MHEYQLRYLPQFDQDLKECVPYIVNKLKNPDAASKLIDETEQAILERLPDVHLCEGPRADVLPASDAQGAG